VRRFYADGNYADGGPPFAVVQRRTQRIVLRTYTEETAESLAELLNRSGWKIPRTKKRS